MTPRIVLDISLLLIPAMMMLGMGVYSFRYRKARGAKSFTALVLGAFLWASCELVRLTLNYYPEAAHSFVIGGLNLTAERFVHALRYAGEVSMPVAWFVMALEYAGWQDKWSERRWMPALIVIPLITTGLVWTNYLAYPLQGLIWSANGYGPWF